MGFDYLNYVDINYTSHYNSDYYYFIHDEKGYCSICKYIGCETDVVIPKKIDDCEVVELRKDAFSGCNFIKSVDLSNIEISRLKRISRDEKLIEAFSNCSSLEYIKIPSGLYITNRTLKGCFNLRFIEFGNQIFDLTSLGMLDDCIALEKCSISNDVRNYVGLYKILKSNKNFKNIKIHIRDGKDGQDYDMETFKTIAFNSDTYNIVDDVYYNPFPYAKFSDCSEIESFVMGKYQRIGDSEEFKNCINLKSYEFNRFFSWIPCSYFEGCVNLEEITIPSCVKEIRPRAFFNCTKLKSIVLPEEMKFLGIYCFGNCKNLETVTFSNNITKIQKGAFKNCSSIKKIVLPECIEEIEEEAFSGCTSLESIVIPESIIKIGKDAFKDCKNLTIKYAKSLNCWNCVYTQNDSTDLNIIFGEDNEIVDESNSYLDFTLSEDGLSYSVKWNGLFGSSIKELVIPNSYKGKPVISIDEKAFNECKYLKSVIISDGIKIIKKRAFSGCKNLESVKLPNSIVKIERECFDKCTDLISINLPNSIKSIGVATFRECDKLTSIELPNSLTKIENFLFEDSGLKFIELPNSIVKIGCRAFANCKLKSINLPNSIISIGKESFSGNSLLESIILPNSIKSLGLGFVICGYSDLYHLPHPEQIFYIGTQSDWNDIEIDDMYDYKVELQKKVCFYSEEKPTNGYIKYWRYVNGKPKLW